MDLPGKVARQEQLKGLLDGFKDCTACQLCKNRRRLFTGFGNPQASVVFVLDRHAIEDVASAEFLAGNPYKVVLQTLFEYAQEDWLDYWFTPVVSCPTMVMPLDRTKMPPEITPLAKASEVAACSVRLHKEVHLLAPDVIVAMGQLAARAFIPKDTPTIHYNLGDTLEGFVQGDFIRYPLPLVLTNSLHTLMSQPDGSAGGPWHKTAQHVHLALSIAKRLREASLCG